MRIHVATTGPEPGNWLITIAEGVCRVLLGSVPAPDARLFTDSEIGHHILAGRMSPDEAVSAGLLSYEGDPAALRRLGACFELGGPA
jgi:hypothetical protein